MNSPLTLIPAQVRLVIYLAYFLLTLAFSSVGSYFLALHEQVPDWAIGGAAAVVPIGAAFAAVAASNTTRQPVTKAAPAEAPDILGKALVSDGALTITGSAPVEASVKTTNDPAPVADGTPAAPAAASTPTDLAAPAGPVA